MQALWLTTRKYTVRGITIFAYNFFCHASEWTFLLCIALFGGHALSFLFTRWSVAFRSRGEAKHITSIDAAQRIMVTPREHRGKPEIVKLERTQVGHTLWTCG